MRVKTWLRAVTLATITIVPSLVPLLLQLKADGMPVRRNPKALESCEGRGIAMSTQTVRNRAAINPLLSVRRDPERAFEIFALTSLGFKTRNRNSVNTSLGSVIPDGIKSFTLRTPDRVYRFVASVFLEATILEGSISTATSNQKGQQALRYIEYLSTDSAAARSPAIRGQRPIPILDFVTSYNTFLSQDIVNRATIQVLEKSLL